MRRSLLLILALVLPTSAMGSLPESAVPQYRIDIDQRTVLSSVREERGKKGLYVTLSFHVVQGSDKDRQTVATDVSRQEIEVREDGKLVDELEIFQPRAQNLTTVLAIDVSGSMKNNGKIDQARKAAQAFLDKLDSRADTGLILFDHEVPTNDPKRFQSPAGEPDQYVAHREKLRGLIAAADPLGGTAYLDAAARALEMLKGVKGRRAVLLLTDGVDMNSSQTLDQVIRQARQAQVPIYTLGIGEPGKKEKVTTVLVLDTSGSMRGKASDQDKRSKMEALKQAASRFVELMRPTAQTTLLPFSTTVGSPGIFSSDRKFLKRRIDQLQPEGGTLLYDATLAGVETLQAARVTGRKAVVVLTDGKDEAPGSRYSDGEVIERAKEESIPLYMLGLGRSRDINEPVMQRMSQQTGGKYYRADSEESLIKIFEQLAIDLHDDGIDVDSLERLAKETGGKYLHTRDVSTLASLYEELAEELQSTYTVTFKSRKQSFDGTARGIEIRVVRGGVQVSDVGQAGYAVRGVVVVPPMNTQTYLVLFLFLGGLLGLLALPAGLGRLRRSKAT